MELRKQKTWTTLDGEDARSPGPPDGLDREQELAATRIQSRVRGKQARCTMHAQRKRMRSVSI